MDKGWTQLPLFVIFLLYLSNAHGFKGRAHSNAHHWWGQPSDKTFSPRTIQSSVSELPVTGILPEEVGSSSLFTNRPLKRLNLLKFVKGSVSSMHESTSHAQTAPSSSILASLPLPLNERYAGSLTSLQGSSGSATTDTASVSTQGESASFPAILDTSGLSTSEQSSPSLYMSSSLETSGAKSAEATLPAFSPESISYSSSSAPGATYTSQGSPLLPSESSGQSISPQGESSYSSLSQSQGASSQYTPDSYNVLSSSSVSSQSTSNPSTPSLYSSSFQGSSGSLLEASGSFQGEVAGLGSLVDLSPQSQEHSSQLLPSPLAVSSQSTNGQSTPSLFMVGSESSSDSQSTGPASPLETQGSLSQSISSQSTSVQNSPSVSTSTQSRSGTQLTSSTFSPVPGGSSPTSSLYQKPQGTPGLYAPASRTKYVSFPMSSHPAVYSQSKSSSGAWFGGSTSFASQGMSSTYGGSVQPQGTTSQFASGSLSSYPSVSLFSPQHPASQSATVENSQKQFTSSYGTQPGSSMPFTLQGSTSYGGPLHPQDTTSQFASSYGTQPGSSKPFTLQGSASYGGSLQPQYTTSQFASGSSSSYPSVSLSSPQHPASQSATVDSSRKQFTSRYGTQSGSSTPFKLQGSTTYGGSLQLQGTTSQFASGSPSSYPSVSLSSPQHPASQSATVDSSRKQFTFTGNSGTQEGSSTPFKLQGSTTYGGSLQLQGTTSQFASGSPSSYPSVSLSSPQHPASQSATVDSSRKQFTSRYGTQSESSKPFTLQGSTSYGESLQPQGTTSQFASSYGTQSESSKPFTLQGSTSYGESLQPQGTTSQFASGSLSSYPSVSLSSPQHPASQSATVDSSRKQFTSRYGTQSGSSTPFKLQGSTTYGGSLQLQGTTSQFASGSPSSYPSVSLSSPQGAPGQSATVETSRKQFTSSYGTQSESSKPFTLQGSTSYGGSLQPQGTTSQFASGSPSSYPSVSLSSPQHPASQSATVDSSRKQFTFTGNSGTQEGSSTPFKLQGSTTYGGSLQLQGTTSQFASGSPSSYPSVSLSSPQHPASQSATVDSSRKQFTSRYGTQSESSKPFTLQGSTSYGESLQPQGTTSQFASSYGTQSESSKPFTLQGSTSYGESLQPQGTTSQFASGSLSSYPSVSLSSPQHPASQSATVDSSRKQFTFTGNSGTQEGSSTPFKLQGSTTYGGSLQLQGTTSQFASGSPSSYPSVSLSSPQHPASQSATVDSSRKQFTSRYGTQSESSKPFTLQGSTSYGESLQPQGTTSQFASSYGTQSESSKPFTLQGSTSYGESLQPQGTTSQFASSYGTQSESSKPFTLQGSTSYGESLQPQGTTSQFASGSLSSYPSVSLSSPQHPASQSATVDSSRKQFTSRYGTQSGSSTPFKLQGSTTYGGSLQLQGTTSQFASGSPSSYPSVSLSSPQGAPGQSATVETSRKQFTSSYGTQSESSKPFTLQGSTSYGGSLQPQGTTSQFASGSLSSYPSVSLSSPQHPASQSATVDSSRKQFTSRYGTQSGSSKPLTLQGSTSYGGSLQPQDTTSQFASGSSSFYPSVSLYSPQGTSSQSATVQNSQKQFTSRYGTQSGSSKPLTLQGSTSYGGSLQPQDTTSQFASGSSSFYPSVSLYSPQGTSSQSATVQNSQKQFASSDGTQSGSSKPFTLQGSTSYGGSLQPQDTTSRFASGSPSSYNCHCVSLSSPQGVADQSSQAFQSYAVSQSLKSQRWQPSQGIQTSAASQGSSLSQSSPMRSLFPSLSSAGASSSGDHGPFVSAQGASSRYGGFSPSQSPSSKYTSGSHAYAKLGSSPLAVSSQSTIDKRTNGLYSSDSLQTQGLIGVVERPSRLSSQAPSDSTSSNQISEHFVTMQRPTGSNLTPSLGLSAQASSVGMFSVIPQTAQTLRKSGSDVRLYNQPFLHPLYSVKG